MGNFALAKDGIFESFDSYNPVEPGQIDPDHVDRFVDQQIRLQSMSSLMSWVDSWDHSYAVLNDLLLGIADLDGDLEISADEEGYFNDLLQGVSAAMLELGADRGLVDSFLNDENKVAGDKIAEFLADKMNAIDARPEEIVVNHGLGAQVILESTQTVVRSGEVIIKKKRVRRKKITSLQKQAAKKNLRKAMSGLSRQKRERSLRIGKKRGIYNR